MQISASEKVLWKDKGSSTSKIAKYIMSWISTIDTRNQTKNQQWAPKNAFRLSQIVSIDFQYQLWNLS